MTAKDTSPIFAPELFISNGVKDISFYEQAFGAAVQMRFSNDDGSVHVAQLSIGGTIFHLHEVTADGNFFSPGKHNGTTIRVGLFVTNVDKVMDTAIKAGAVEISAAQDYDYGYRQGILKDPFGHYWQIQQKIVSI